MYQQKQVFAGAVNATDSESFESWIAKVNSGDEHVILSDYPLVSYDPSREW